jgi:hypothetical protein
VQSDFGKDIATKLAIEIDVLNWNARGEKTLNALARHVGSYSDSDVSPKTISIATTRDALCIGATGPNMLNQLAIAGFEGVNG